MLIRRTKNPATEFGEQLERLERVELVEVGKPQRGRVENRHGRLPPFESET